MVNKKKVVIIGAGPAGLCAALKLSLDSNYEVSIYEAEDSVGGLSKTLKFHGNLIDIGPHRFFSKVDEVVDCWKTILGDNLLVKDRCTRIYFLNKFFDYPIKLCAQTLINLGLIRTLKIGFSYLHSILFKIMPEKSLEDFFINRFGNELYETFFKDYTQKVWGLPCSEIGASWGAQRVKELSIVKTIIHAIKSVVKPYKSVDKNVETSLSEYFYYPKNGAGMMWDEIAKTLKERGVKIFLNTKIISLASSSGSIYSVSCHNTSTKEYFEIDSDFVISSMPVVDLINGLNNVPQEVSFVANKLVYRDLIVVGMAFKKFIREDLIDNWIYLQDRNIKAGRMEIYNNFSTEMLADKNSVWMGVEYFCNVGDDIWSFSDDKIVEFAKSELIKMNLVDSSDYLDGFVMRINKAYPAYFGSYEQFDKIRAYTDSINNLFLIGRNGMHRYNNMDHSMVSGFVAAENILSGKLEKDNLWNINTEEEYHESK